MKYGYQAALFALIISVASVAIADSNTPKAPAADASAASVRRVPSSDAGSSGAIDTRGRSPSSPVFVSLPEDSNGKTIANWTIVLGICTVLLAGLAGIQALLLCKQGKDVKTTAEAAKESARVAADALTKLERPFVLANLQPHAKEPVEHPDVVIFNFGRSPAALDEIAFSGVDLTIGSTPNWTAPLMHQRALPYGTVVLNPTSHHEVSTFFKTPNPAPGTERWFFGHVNYVDMLDQRYSLTFSFKWDIAAARWYRHSTMNGLRKL